MVYFKESYSVILNVCKAVKNVYGETRYSHLLLKIDARTSEIFIFSVEDGFSQGVNSIPYAPEIWEEFFFFFWGGGCIMIYLTFLVEVGLGSKNVNQ